MVKRAVGPGAWAVLEDIALDAVLDEDGRLVAETNTRQVATNLGLNKDTVTPHLRRLREYGFVLKEESRTVTSGRYEVYRYVLDPSACIERFTHTPPAQQRSGGEASAEAVAPQAPGAQPAAPPATGQEPAAPCPKNSDAVAREPVSEKAGHGGTGHGVSDTYIEMLMLIIKNM